MAMLDAVIPDIGGLTSGAAEYTRSFMQVAGLHEDGHCKS